MVTILIRIVIDADIPDNSYSIGSLRTVTVICDGMVVMARKGRGREVRWLGNGAGEGGGFGVIWGEVIVSIKDFVFERAESTRHKSGLGLVWVGGVGVGRGCGIVFGFGPGGGVWEGKWGDDIINIPPQKGFGSGLVVNRAVV